MDRASSRLLVVAFVAIGLLTALLWVLPRRITMERTSRTVETALDYDAYSEYFHAQGIDEDEGFQQMHAKGATAVAFNENYLSTLQLNGHVKLYTGTDLPKYRTIENLPDGPVVATRQYLIIYDDASFNDLMTMCKLLVGSDKVVEWGRTPGTVQASPSQPRVIEVVGSARFLSGVGLGFSSALVQHFRNMGFNVVLRPENKTNLGPGLIDGYFAALPKADYIVFGGTRNEALGYPVPECLDAVLKNLNQYGLRLGIVEVPSPKAALKGEEYLARHDCGMAVRVQSIAPAQLSRLAPSDALDMFQLGVRERDVRMIFLRPFADPDTGKTLTDTNLDYLDSLEKMLVANHFQQGLASVFPDVASLPIIPTLLLNLAVGAAAALVLLYLRPSISPSLLLGIPMLMAVGALGAAAVHHAETWSKLAALGGALAMASLGMMDFQNQLDRPGPNPYIQTFVWFMRATLISLGGGFLVASLLAYTPFMLEIDQFRGIKLLMLVPPAVVLLYALARQGASIRAVLRAGWRLPLTVGGMICLLALVAGTVFFIMRTGNTPETGASDTERYVRNLLQTIFVARPRFKDFCIGHPAFILLSMWSLAVPNMRRSVYWLLLVLATIGQADVVDTFAHIHTPFLISLLRVFNGWWLGAAIGIVIAALWKRPPIPTAKTSPNGSPSPVVVSVLPAAQLPNP